MVRAELVREKIRRLRTTLAMLARVLPAEASALSDPAVDTGKLHEAATDLATLGESYCARVLSWAEAQG